MIANLLNIERIQPERLAQFRRTWRLPLLALSLIVFCAGAWWSFRSLDISPAQLRLAPLGIVALLMVPSLLYSGLGLSLLARSAGTTIPVGRATVVGAYASLAELLPIPGGAIVRTGAVMKAGASLQRSSALVVVTAVLWIALAMIGAGLSLLAAAPHLAFPLLILGGVSTLAISVWLWSTAGTAIAVATLLHRLAGIFLVGLRLQFAFAATHANAGFLETLPFVLANILGSASSIAPAGIGISEALAALVATTTALPPETAFLAVGLDRLAVVLACLCTVLAEKTVRKFRAG